MMWEEKRFDEIGTIERGRSRHRPRNDESLYGGIYPFIQTGEVKSANLYISEFTQTYNEKGLDQSRLWRPGTLCITIAANIAETAILAIDACFPDSIIGFIADDTKCDVRFVKYFFDIWKKQIQMISQGATQDNLSLEKLLTFKVPCPPLPTQQKIASILSTYDDLIESNHKRIRLLEEAAQHLYREWFVKFRFPGSEGIKFVDGLPEGWHSVNLYDFAEIQMGHPFRSEDFNEDGIGIPAIRIRDIPNHWTKTFAKSSPSNDYIVRQSDILVGMDGFFYTDVWGGQVGYLVQRVCRIRPKENRLNGYLLEAIRGPIAHFEKTISGATVAHLGAKHLKEIEILVPDDKMLKDLEIFNHLLLQKVALLQQNQKLKEARDLLLPRLMNQTIEV